MSLTVASNGRSGAAGDNTHLRKRVIALVHRGPSWYLPYVVRQARIFNPKAAIVLFADRPWWHLRTFCRIERIDDYMQTAREIEPFFENFSVNPREYELFCIQRWAILLEYARRRNILEMVHLDSDVLLYTDLWHCIDSEWANFDLVATGFQGPQTMFIRNVAALAAFWEYTLEAYRSDIEGLRKSYLSWQARGLIGGISDMHFLHEFISAHREQFHFGDNSTPRNGTRFDDVFDDTPEDVPGSAGPRIKIHDEAPWGVDTHSGERLKYHSLHFQGLSKKYIPQFSTRRDAWIPLFAALNRVHRLIAK
jgi:hypothetical protein